MCTLVCKTRAGATEREDPERTESAADQAQVFSGGWATWDSAGQIQPSPEEEDGLGGKTKVRGSYGSRLKLLWTVRFGGTPERLSLLLLL